MASNHRADVDRIAPKLAKAIRGVLSDQKSRYRASVNTKAEIAKTKAALLPHMVTAVHTGAKRVAGVVGTGTPAPNTTIAGAWAYKAASQLATTTQGQLDGLTDTATTDDVAAVFDARADAALAVAATLISNAINSGADNYAKTLPTGTQPSKTWDVNDDHPCTECSSADGETVPAHETFSNGSPHGPIHDGCMCSVTWSASSTTRSSRGVTMTEERAKYSADDMKDLLAKGKAMKNPSGDPSYPVADQEDIEKAIHAVGRGGADHDAIRLHIINGAKALHLTHLIPDNWSADGSLKTQKSENPDGETRATGKVKCKTCTGTGKIREGHVTCPDCEGTGEVVPEGATNTEAGSSAPRRPRRQRRTLVRAPERRTISARMEMRTAEDGDTVLLRGVPVRYATAYDVRDMFGTFRETMHRGVAENVLAAQDFDCRFLVNHDGLPLARSVSGTLTLADTPRGLQCEARLDPRQSAANDLAIAVERGDITQMSCGFIVASDGDEWRVADDGIEERDVYSFDELFDVSAVTYPASPSTSIEIAQRALLAVNVESRERVRRLWNIAKDLREGKVLSQQNGQELMAALEALHEADDVDIPGIVRQLQTIDQALDKGQAGLSSVLGRANPDGGPQDEEPALTPAPDDETKRAIQRQRLQIVRARHSLVA